MEVFGSQSSLRIECARYGTLSYIAANPLFIINSSPPLSFTIFSYDHWVRTLEAVDKKTNNWISYKLQKMYKTMLSVLVPCSSNVAY